MKRIVLASASPRRKELLEQIGLKFTVDPSNHDEDMQDGRKPHALARTLSLEKARAVAPRHADALIIAADTFIIFGDRLMGKARTDAEAREMLATLKGETHSVITGYTVLDTAGGRRAIDSVETRVRFRPFTEAEMAAYIASGEPIGKAGAYAIQGRGAVIVDRIEGDYANVVGLPLTALAETLKQFGVAVL